MELSGHYPKLQVENIARRTLLAGLFGTTVLALAGCGNDGRRTNGGGGGPGGSLTAPSVAPTTEVASGLATATPEQAQVAVDSAMTLEEALAGKDMPEAVRNAQRLVDVEYLGFDGLGHRGQLVIDERVAEDIPPIFNDLKSIGFPVQGVVPVAVYGWDDEASMQANNSSAFNYRPVAGSDVLSEHARGALDLNPRLNPYIRGDFVQPAGAVYEPGAKGVIAAGDPMVQIFKDRGWEWGGDWDGLKDYQHFEKP